MNDLDERRHLKDGHNRSFRSTLRLSEVIGHMSVRDQMIDQNEIVLDDLKTMMRRGGKKKENRMKYNSWKKRRTKKLELVEESLQNKKLGLRFC